MALWVAATFRGDKNNCYFKRGYITPAVECRSSYPLDDRGIDTHTMVPFPPKRAREDIWKGVNRFAVGMHDEEEKKNPLCGVHLLRGVYLNRRTREPAGHITLDMVVLWDGLLSGIFFTLCGLTLLSQ